jgi:hypothetical protein
MVKKLITQRSAVPLRLYRTIVFGTDTITISDRIEGKLPLGWLEYGHPFASIHMASARYFGGDSGHTLFKPRRIDVSTLNLGGEIEKQEIL